MVDHPHIGAVSRMRIAALDERRRNEQMRTSAARHRRAAGDDGTSRAAIRAPGPLARLASSHRLWTRMRRGGAVASTSSARVPLSTPGGTRRRRRCARHPVIGSAARTLGTTPSARGPSPRPCHEPLRTVEPQHHRAGDAVGVQARRGSHGDQTRAVSETRNRLSRVGQPGAVPRESTHAEPVGQDADF